MISNMMPKHTNKNEKIIFIYVIPVGCSIMPGSGLATE